MHHQGLGSVDPTGSCGDEMLEAIDDVAFVYASGVGWFVSAVTGCNY